MISMKLYNTLTRTKEEFIPLEEGKVKMYVCGPTVYNYIHIGNARPFIMFDTLRRYLQYKGYDVTFVQNFTDVDDKIIKRGHEEGISPEDVANKYINEYFVDADGLGIQRADVHPRVTDNIQQIIDFVKDLEDKGYAYEVNGDVLLKLQESLNRKSDFISCFNKRGSKFFVNLKQINRFQLEDIGVLKRNIEMSECCSICHSTEYFSFRASAGKTGRAAIGIMLKS